MSLSRAWSPTRLPWHCHHAACFWWLFAPLPGLFGLSGPLCSGWGHRGNLGILVAHVLPRLRPGLMRWWFRCILPFHFFRPSDLGFVALLVSRCRNSGSNLHRCVLLVLFIWVAGLFFHLSSLIVFGSSWDVNISTKASVPLWSRYTWLCQFNSSVY